MLDAGATGSISFLRRSQSKIVHRYPALVAGIDQRASMRRVKAATHDARSMGLPSG